MSVIGIDFGNDNCYIAVARQGGIETIANDYSLRATPSCVAFGPKCRYMGVAAINQRTTNLKNTVVNFKRFIGKLYNDPRITEDLENLPYTVVEQKDGGIGIVVNYLGNEKVFSVPQITAVLFTKLKITAEIALNIKIVDVVIGVPCYFDDASRRVMLESATAAGLNVLRLMNETTAVALAYGIYKQDLPALEEKPRNVVFVDCGHASLQVSVVAFNKGKLKMITTAADEHLGGRDFDRIMVDQFAADFKNRYKLNAFGNPKAMVRLFTEVEKLKKQMSANATVLPINIECFLNDKDVSGKMKRSDLEELCPSLMQRVSNTLHLCLSESGLSFDDIYSVEIVGGSTRVPGIKQTIEKVFKKVPSTTLNADEAVARGCALQCAMLSPTFKVRDFSITDVQPYSIKLVWTDESGKEADMQVFPKNHPIPFSKMLTFQRKSTLVIEAYYSAPSPCPDPLVGQFTVRDIAPSSEGDYQRVKVKLRLNIHGLFMVASATMAEKKEVVEDDKNEQQSPENQENEKVTNGPKEETNSKEGDATEDQKMDVEKNGDDSNEASQERKAKKVKTVDLRIESVVKQLDNYSLNILIEQESQMVQSDKQENDRINAKNAVEEYVYDMRDKICGELEKFISQQDRENFSLSLKETEDWLYEEGEDCQKQIYIDRLADLKKYGEPLKLRKREREDVPKAFEFFLSSMQIAKKILAAYQKGDEEYAHLDLADMERVDKAIHERELWTNNNVGLIGSTPLHLDLPITSGQLCSEKGTFDALVVPIINKPKPKPKVEEPVPQPSESETKPENESEKEENNQTPDNMDVD